MLSVRARCVERRSNDSASLPAALARKPNLLRTRHYGPGRGHEQLTARAGRHEQVACPRRSLVVLSTHHAYAGATVALRATPSICTFDQQREASGVVARLSPEQTRGGPRRVGAGRCCWNTPHAAQLAAASAHLLTALMPGCPARGRRGQTSTRTTLRQCATDYEPPGDAVAQC